MLASGRGPAQRQMKELQGVFHRVVSRVSAVTLPAPADGAGRIPMRARNVTVAVITRLVRLSSRYAWPTILTVPSVLGIIDPQMARDKAGEPKSKEKNDYLSRNSAGGDEVVRHEKHPLDSASEGLPPSHVQNAPRQGGPAVVKKT